MTDEPTLKFDPDWVVAPGDTLEEWCEENKLPTRVAAVTCRIERGTFEGIIDGSVRITEDLAQRLAQGTGIPAYLWLNLERAFRIGLAAGKIWSR